MVTNKNSDLQSLSLEALLTFSSSRIYFSNKEDLIAPWIIDKIRKREEEKKRINEQPRVYIEDDMPYQPPMEKHDDPERGVIIIDINEDDDSGMYKVL